MNMHLLDWGIVAGLVTVLVLAAFSTRRYSTSVSGFLAAERCAGRYLISVAYGMAGLGVTTLVWYFEQNYDVGFTSIWWPFMEGPAWIIMGLTGWVVYRYRQTRAMTLAQFFEMRYSRKFRIFAGLIAFVSGIINFGIFPSVSARFFIALCGLPDHFNIGGLPVSTFAALMFLLVLLALFFTFIGGQIAVMVTDFLQGAFVNVTFIVLIVFLLRMFRWDQISATLLAVPEQQSMVHPFKLAAEKQFDFWFYAIAVFTMFYTAMAWQGTQGYNCAARNPHEAKMAGILSGWRFRVLMLIVLVLPICVRTLLNHPDFANQAGVLNEHIAAIHGRTVEETNTLRNQLRTPLALAVILPSGLLGLACAAALAAHTATHGAYLHSWGAILIQDVVLPFRRAPLSPRLHLWLLRLAVCGVALFIFVFSLLFQHTQYIAMFLILTGAVFFGGAGSVIIGGLYWKRGTTHAAWSAMLVGMVLSAVSILVYQIDEGMLHSIQRHAWWSWLGSAALFIKTRFTGQELSFLAMAAAITTYVLVSLVGPRAVHNMDKLLHRGEYAVAGETAELGKPQHWWEKLGFTREFTGRDRVITYITLGWPLFWTVVFIVGTAYNLAVDVPSTAWLSFWHGWTWFILGCAILVTVWFTIGGFRDLRALYRLLRTRRENPLDDGRVAESEQEPAAARVD